MGKPTVQLEIGDSMRASHELPRTGIILPSLSHDVKNAFGTRFGQFEQPVESLLGVKTSNPENSMGPSSDRTSSFAAYPRVQGTTSD
jgi:hypothetical protein